MAKPEPLPVLKGTQARDLAEKLENPAAAPEAKKLFRGALAEYRESERRRSKSRSTE